MTFRALLGNSFTITQILLHSGRFYSEIIYPLQITIPDSTLPPPSQVSRITACSEENAVEDRAYPGSSTVATDCSGIRGLRERGRKERDQLFST